MNHHANPFIPHRWIRSRKCADVFQWFFYLFLWGATVSLGVWLGYRMGSVRSGFIAGLSLVTVCLFYASVCLSWHLRKLVQQEQSESDVARVKRLLVPLCERAGLRAPRIFIMSTPAANACAAGVLHGMRYVGVTKGALKLLDDRELEAVLAHEVTHLQRRDSLFDGWWIALSGIVVWISAFSVGFGIASLMSSTRAQNDKDRSSGAGMGIFMIFAGIVFGVVSVFFIQVVLHNIMRRREYRADEGAVILTGSATPLIHALKKLESSDPMLGTQSALAMLFSVNPAPKKGWWDALFATHPKTSKRIARLEVLARELGEVNHI